VLGEPQSQEGVMLFVTHFSIFLLILRYVLQISFAIETEVDGVADSSRVVSIPSGWQASDGSHIEKGWGHHPTFEVECVSRRLEEMQRSYQHFLTIPKSSFRKLDQIEDTIVLPDTSIIILDPNYPVLILISYVRSRPKDLVGVLNVTKVVGLIEVNPRGARFVDGENRHSVFIPIVFIRLRASKSINSVVQGVRKNYLSFLELLQP
jgi:hypothetical protein